MGRAEEVAESGRLATASTHASIPVGQPPSLELCLHLQGPISADRRILPAFHHTLLMETACLLQQGHV